MEDEELVLLRKVVVKLLAKAEAGPLTSEDMKDLNAFARSHLELLYDLTNDLTDTRDRLKEEKESSELMVQLLGRYQQQLKDRERALTEARRHLAEVQEHFRRTLRSDEHGQ